MIEKKEKVIDGCTFYVTQFPAFKALKMKAKLAHLLGPAFSGLMKTMPKGVKGVKAADLKLSEAGPVIESLAASLDPDAFATACFEIFSCTIAVVEEKKLELANMAAFDQAFTGRLEVMYKAMYYVLEVNDFFGLGGIGRALGELAATKLPKPESMPQKEN